MVERPRRLPLARRAVVFLLAFAVAWVVSGLLLPDGNVLAQRAASKKGGKKARPVEENPCANFAFEALPVNEEAGKGAGRDALLSARQSGTLPPGTEGAFDAVFAEYYLPRLTQCREIFAGGYQRLLKEISAQIRSVPKGTARDRLNGVILREGQKIAQGNYHPAARYNAMLMIAELNVDDGDVAAKGPATPYAEALPVMITALTDAKQHDAVRTAALIGIDRHVRNGNLGNDAPRLTAAMIALLDQKSPPTGRSAEAHDWIRSQAASVLEAMRVVGPKNEVVTSLEAVVNDAEASSSLRARAARALGSLDYSKAKQVDPSAVAAQIAAMAVSLYNAEKKEKNALNEFPNRRLLKSWFQSVNIGLVGTGGPDNKESLLALAKTAGDPHATFVTELATRMEAVATNEMFDTEYVEPTTTLPNNFVELAANMRQLENFLKNNRPKKPAAAAPAAAGGEGKTAAPAPTATPPAAASPAASPSPPAAAPAAKQ